MAANPPRAAASRHASGTCSTTQPATRAAASSVVVSAYHWSKSGGTLANTARSHWQIARVYSTLGRGEPAVWHATRCLELAEAAVKAGVADDWDVPGALEGLARAQAVAGDRAAAEVTRARALQAVQAIADPEDRQLIEQDVETTPL